MHPTPTVSNPHNTRTLRQVFSTEPGTACAAAWNPIFEWVPSQKGFFVDAPQRQSTVLAWVDKTFPLVSRSSTVPVPTYGQFGLASIVTSAMSKPPSGEISLIDDYRKRRNMRNQRCPLLHGY